MLPADICLADPRAYVRLAAIVRQQIIDGTLERGQPAPSPGSARSTGTRGRPAARRCARWKAKGS